jgi:RHH-type rel operon transcriptional repressor/antitoxin RelB
MIGVRLHPDLESRLNTLAKQTHRSKSFYVQRALEEFLDEQEDLFLAEAVSQRLRDKKEKTHSLEKVMAELKIGDHETVDH